MENVIGWLLVAAFFVIPVGAVIWFVRHYRVTQQQYKDKLDRYQVEIQAYHDREQERRRQQSLKPSLTSIPATRSFSGTSGTRSYAQSATSLSQTTSTSSADDLQDLAMMYVLNAALQHGSASASVDYDTNTVRASAPAEPSPVDNDDDRRAVADTFSSSDSSSSWSSSDNGPSSDW